MHWGKDPIMLNCTSLSGLFHESHARHCHQIEDATQSLLLLSITTTQTALAQSFDKYILPLILPIHSPHWAQFSYCYLYNIADASYSTASSVEAKARAPWKASYSSGIGDWASLLLWNTIWLTEAKVHTLQATSQCQYKNLSFRNPPSRTLLGLNYLCEIQPPSHQEAEFNPLFPASGRVDIFLSSHICFRNTS